MLKQPVRWIHIAWMALLCMAPSVAPLPAQEGVSFRPQREFGVGNVPQLVTTGDFNRDGIIDLAVATATDVSILLGYGDGLFRPAQRFLAGNNPSAIAVSDFNGDNIQDLAVTNFGSHNVALLIGNGDGTFREAQFFPVGAYPKFVAVGDFNGDDLADLAVANQGANYVSILLGNGDATFRLIQNVESGVAPTAIAIGDLNGDGLPDLAVANRDSNDVYTFMGNGDGTFGYARNFLAGTGPVSVTVGDFNGDNAQDLVIANSGNFSTIERTISLLIGNGDGTFQPTQTLAAGLGPMSVATGDFNGDNKLDIVAANFGREICVLGCSYTRSTTVALFLGQGDGTFAPAQFFEVGVGPKSVIVGDFNGDNRPDLATANGGPGGPPSVSILINDTVQP